MPSIERALIVIACLFATLLPAVGGASDWPRYRGPEQDGISQESGLLATWPEGGPEELWRFRLGEGYSGISVADGRVYTQFGQGGDEFAVCLDAATGREIWRRRTDDNRPDEQGGGPRSTPTVEGDTVYFLTARGKLWALDAANGRSRWRVDLVETHGASPPQWGVSTSPVVEGDLLLLDIGGRSDRSLVALDKATGELRWGSQNDKAGYSTPLAVTVGGIRQILFFTGTALVSVSPVDGELLWRHPWKTSYDVNAAMPIFVAPNRVFISSAYDKGAALLEVSVRGDDVAVREVWSSRVMQNQFNTSVLIGDYLYGFHRNILKCIHVGSGREVWAERGFGRGSLIYAGGNLIVLGERGVLALAEAGPDGYRELARAQIFRAKTWTMPTLSDGRLFLRSEGELVALDLRAQAVRSNPRSP